MSFITRNMLVKFGIDQKRESKPKKIIPPDKSNKFRIKKSYHEEDELIKLKKLGWYMTFSLEVMELSNKEIFIKPNIFFNKKVMNFSL